jgi:MbtH protein
MSGEPPDHHRVLVNHEEQYSLWPAHLAVPAGWTDIGVEGTEAECCAWVDAHWTDMRPKSLREALAAAPSASTHHR